MNSREVIWYKKAQKSNAVEAKHAGIKKAAAIRQEIITEETQLVALTFVNNVINKIYEVASSNAIFSRRWLLVKLGCPVQIAVAIDNYDIETSEDIVDIPVIYGSIYTKTALFQKTTTILLKDFLEEQGFYSIGNEVPSLCGNELLSEENSWYALELN